LSVPDARVQILRIETSDVIRLRTNYLGRYYAPNLPLGTYRVTVEKEGFRTAQLDNVILQSQMSVRADFTLQVGAVTVTVQVVRAAAGAKMARQPDGDGSVLRQ
jgi:hypothetical protein